MTRRRGLLFAVLIYVTLDLSLAVMPGAFVFEPNDSVESINVQRGREAPELVFLLTPQLEPLLAVQPHRERTHFGPTVGGIPPVLDRVVYTLARALLDSAAPSEDSD